MSANIERSSELERDFQHSYVSKLNSSRFLGLRINSSLSQMQIRYHTIKRVGGVSDWWGGGGGGDTVVAIPLEEYP